MFSAMLVDAAFEMLKVGCESEARKTVRDWLSQSQLEFRTDNLCFYCSLAFVD